MLSVGQKALNIYHIKVAKEPCNLYLGLEINIMNLEKSKLFS